MRTYIDLDSVIALKFDNRLATRLQLDPVLGPKPGHDLDGIRSRHGGAKNSKCNELTKPSTHVEGYGQEKMDRQAR